MFRINRTSRLLKLAAIGISFVALSGCVTAEYVVGAGTGIDGDVYRSYEIIGFVTTEIIQRERATAGILDFDGPQFTFTGFRQNLLDAAREQYPDVDDVIRVVVTPTQVVNTTNFLFFGDTVYEDAVYHIEGVAIRYND
ncbi:MAG: hypothetical protein ACOC4F_01480 [bacterium]